MTLDQLKAIDARDLDALFAERVVGYKWVKPWPASSGPTDEWVILASSEYSERFTLRREGCETDERYVDWNTSPVWSLEQIAEFAYKVNDEDAVGFVQAMREVLGAVMRFPTAVFFVSREDRMRVLIWAEGMGNG